MNSSNGLELALIKQQIAQLCAFSLGKTKNRGTAAKLFAIGHCEGKPADRGSAAGCNSIRSDAVLWNPRSFTVFAYGAAGRVCTPQELIQAADHARGVSGAQGYLKSGGAALQGNP